jgi:urea transport system permease protein
LSVPSAKQASARRSSPSRKLIQFGPLLLIVLLAVLMLFFPAALSPYNLVLATQFILYVVVALSLQLLWGRAGQLSFGQAAFFGMGAFAYGVMGTRFHHSGWVSIGASILIPLIVGLLLGYFLFFGGVRGAYFGIVTLAFVLIANQTAISWKSVTGGDSGLTGIPGLVVHVGGFSLDFSTALGGYSLAVAVLLISLLTSLAVRLTPFGLVLEAIRENEHRAAFLGYNTPAYLTAVLGLSAAMAGLAGGAFASVSNYAAPDMMSSLLSIEMLTWVAVGGRNYVVGAMIGTLVMRGLNVEVSGLFPTSWPLFIGAFFVVVVMFFPGGIAGVVVAVSRRAQFAPRAWQGQAEGPQ